MENYTIDRENKTFIFDDGSVVPIPKDKVKQVLRSPAAQKSKQESIEKWQQWNQRVPVGEEGHAFLNNLSESTFGNLGDTLANYGVSAAKAFTPGEGQEDLGYVDRLLEHFYAMQEGRKEHLAAQSEASPNAAMAGQVGGLGLELGSLAGLSAAKALPIMGAAHSETSFLEPSEKIPELGKEAITGFLLDKFLGGASKVAGHRQTRRALQDVIRDTEEANVAEAQRATRATEADQVRFAQESAAREAELASLPQRQQAANQQFIDSSAQRVNRVAQTIGKNPIAVEAVGVEPFIENVLERSAHAATTEGNRVSKFLRSVFKPDKSGKISGEAIQKGMKAIDETIAKESGAVRNMLVDFKGYLAEELPGRIGNYYAFEKWSPRFQTKIIPIVENDLTDVFRNANSIYTDVQGQLGKNFLTDLNKSIKQNINDIFASHSGNFEGALRDGTISREVEQMIRNNPMYMQLVDDLAEYDFIVGKNKKFGEFKMQRQNISPEIGNVRQKVADYPSQIAEKTNNLIDRYMPDVSLDVSQKSGVTQNSLSKSPVSPQVVPEPAQVNPAQTFEPNLQPVPTIPAPQGLLQNLAYGLESLAEGGIGGAAQAVKENALPGLLAKSLGLPLGKMVAGGAALISGLSAFTSPALGGRIARSTLDVTARAFDAVAQRAAQYPSHRANGVLEDPKERRSLVKEIEDDIYMTLEDKAILQSKINRGQPLIVKR